MISNTSHVSELGNETQITTKETEKLHPMRCRQSGLEFRKSSLNPRLDTLPLRCSGDVKDHRIVKGAQDK